MQSPPVESAVAPLTIDGPAQLGNLFGIIHESKDPVKDLLHQGGFSVQKCVSSIQGAGKHVQTF